MIKAWSDLAWEDYLYWQKQDKRTLKKINDLIKNIDRNGYNCTGKVEPLKGDLTGYYSVHIDQTNRIVFKIDDNILYIAQCRTHYNK